MEALLEFLLSNYWKVNILLLPFWHLCIALFVKGLILLSKQAIMLVTRDHFIFSILNSFIFLTQGHDTQ